MHNDTIPYIIRFKIKHTKYSSHNERIYTKIVLTYMQQKEQNSTNRHNKNRFGLRTFHHLYNPFPKQKLFCYRT